MINKKYSLNVIELGSLTYKSTPITELMLRNGNAILHLLLYFHIGIKINSIITISITEVGNLSYCSSGSLAFYHLLVDYCFHSGFMQVL